jgi:transcriptional regulator of acetoin/glycerol metabolism
VQEWMTQKNLPAEGSRVSSVTQIFVSDAGGGLVRELGDRSVGDVVPQLQSSMEQIERWAIERALVASNGDLTKAAQWLSLSRTTIWRKIKQWQQREGNGGPKEPADGTEFA